MHPVFTIVVGMEQLDRDACARLAKLLGGAPVFSSDRFDMYQLVSILRCCQRIVSSRYHAIVTSMPGGVVSAGVTMDERIRNLMRERGHDHLVLDVDDAELEEKLFAVLETLDREAEAIRESMSRTVTRNLKLMARMGTYFEEQVARRYPEFPVRTGSLAWEDYLPPLGPALQSLLEVHA
jgi:polysaccharide pyruvyl transferase WcaK-like protein